MMSVQRAELVTKDMAMITELTSSMYVQHKARTRRIPEARPDASVRGAVAGQLRAGVVRIPGVEYEVESADSSGVAFGVVAIEGSGEVTAGRDCHRFTAGEAFMALPDRPYASRIRGVSAALLQIPMRVAGQVAEEMTGLPASELRFESMAPVSQAAGALWVRTVGYGCRQLIESGITQINSLIAYELSRLAAAALLESFPNTSMTVPYLPGPGWTAPAAVRRAAAFIETHAAQPVTTADIAAAAGVTIRALQYAFRRHCDTTPTGFLRRVRLERAHLDLHNAEPGGGLSVAAVARAWGWASPAHFAAAYRQRFGVLPSHTLRDALPSPQSSAR